MQGQAFSLVGCKVYRSHHDHTSDKCIGIFMTASIFYTASIDAAGDGFRVMIARWTVTLHILWPDASEQLAHHLVSNKLLLSSSDQRQAACHMQLYLHSPCGHCQRCTPGSLRSAVLADTTMQTIKLRSISIHTVTAIPSIDTAL